MDKPQNINLHAVRLCFHLKYETIGANGVKIFEYLPPIVSNPIKDKKKNENPKIHEISAISTSALGGDRILLFCDKVQKEDIKIIFYDDSNWKVEVSTLKVHHQYGIAFKTPPYKNVDITEAKKASMKLYRPSDHQSSDPITFEFLPTQKSMSMNYVAFVYFHFLFHFF